MTSFGTLTKANQLISEHRGKARVFNDPHYIVLLYHLLNRGESSFNTIIDELAYPIQGAKEILNDLLNQELITEHNGIFSVTPATRKRLGYGSYSLDHLVGSTLSADSTKIPNALRNSYQILESIGKGATSTTFKAKQINTHKYRTLKIFFPDTLTYELLDDALRRRNEISNDALPGIIDAGQVEIVLGNDTKLITPCVVLEYIDGDTFEKFLGGKKLDSSDFNRFIERVGGALSSIEAVGLIHGDLHERNILVTPQNPDFWVIDFIGVPSSASKELYILSDMENFKNHFIRISIMACELNPGVSASRLMGEKAFNVLQNLRKNVYNNFADLMNDFTKPHQDIPSGFFKKPESKPFEWLRVEQIDDPSWLFKLFVVAPVQFGTISRFGNTWVSGPAGCGKSHYLKVLDFYPDVLAAADSDEELNKRLQEIKYDFRTSFGVMFPCRLGEFKVFSPETLGREKFDSDTQIFLKHILILKIWNKCMVRLLRGMEIRSPKTGHSILQIPSISEMNGLSKYISERIGIIEIFGETTPISIFHRCFSATTSLENISIASWNDIDRRNNLNIPKLLDEKDLDDFLGKIQETFDDLRSTRFLILVDDASYGQIHFEMQKILNSLVRSSQSRHCFKITCDRYMYTLDTSDGRAMNPSVEGTYVDLSEVSAKTSRGGTVRFSDYMAAVINRRLNAAKYKTNIKSILGASQDVSAFLSALSQPRKRKSLKSISKNVLNSRSHAYYGGWNIIVNLSHGSVRTLLELLEYVFRVNNVTQETLSIPLRNQDSAVRKYSDRRFRALSMMLPGEIDNQPLGECLQNVISAIGEVSRRYLREYKTGDINRWYETITIERNDRKRLDKKAELVLEKLVEFNLFIAQGISFSRSQFGLSARYDLNKIFTPAFETTYRVRNHMYLSKNQFNTVLLKPDEFVRTYRNKLKKLSERQKEHETQDLFELNNDNDHK